jgi:multidrug efflux pump subunit AcrB
VNGIDRSQRAWLERPVAAVCVTLALLVTSAAVIVSGSGGGAAIEDSPVWSVTIKHYGVDAREMERGVAIPLEDALQALENVKSVVTTSENGSARAYVVFKSPPPLLGGTKTAGRYEAVREAAQRVYEKLPASAQRPELVSASESRLPAWTAAVFYGDGSPVRGDLPEKVIKPAFLSLEGVADVELSGAGQDEIVVTLKNKALGEKLTAFDVARALAENDGLFPAGVIKEAEAEIPLVVDGRSRNTVELESARIPLAGGGSTALGAVAAVVRRERQPDILARLNGKNAALVSVIPADGCDMGRLSAAIKALLKKPELADLRWTVLADLGESEARSFRSVCRAALQAAAAVALLSFCIGRNSGRGGLRRALVLAAAIPVMCVFAAALLVLLGHNLSKTALAGISTGLGAAVDACLLSAEQLARHGTRKVAKLRGELVCGAATTIIALVPLGLLPFGTPYGGGGITMIAVAIACVTAASLAAALFLLPPVFLAVLDKAPAASPERPHRVWRVPACRGLRRGGRRLFARALALAYHRPRLVIAAAGGVCCAGALALALAGVDTGYDASEDSVYARVEFEAGLLAQEADSRLADWAYAMSARAGVKNVQTGARTGSASVLITFDPRALDAKTVREIVRGNAPEGGFVYIAEAGRESRNWNISVTGGDEKTCRALAREIAFAAAAIPLVHEAVLNFKEGGTKLLFTPNRAVLAQMSAACGRPVQYGHLAGELRRAVHGPVAYKRRTGGAAGGMGGEMDVRVKGISADMPRRKDVEDMALYDGVSRALPLSAVMRQSEETAESSIRREERRRCAGVTIRTPPVSARKLRAVVMREIAKIEMPAGYCAEFDREAVENARALSAGGFYFILALLLCYMIIAAVHESFVLPLLVLAVVPSSAAFCALVLAMAGGTVNAASVCAFIAVCGLAVNAAVITAGELYGRSRRAPWCFGFVYTAVRRRVNVLSITTLTTIAAALPFLFLRENTNMLVRALAAITALGVAASYVCAIMLVPALLRLVERRRQWSGKNSRHGTRKR